MTQRRQKLLFFFFWLILFFKKCMNSLHPKSFLPLFVLKSYNLTTLWIVMCLSLFGSRQSEKGYKACWLRKDTFRWKDDTRSSVRPRLLSLSVPRGKVTMSQKMLERGEWSHSSLSYLCSLVHLMAVLMCPVQFRCVKMLFWAHLQM